MLLPSPREALAQTIRDEIRRHGTISFARFMDLALYCPELGYYDPNKNSVGRAGDFYTNVSVGPLFGELLAFQFARWLDDLPGPCRHLVETGAHDGTLARDILTWLHQHRPATLQGLEYWIVEPSSRRQQCQRQRLQAFAGRVHWLDSWEASTPEFARIGSPNVGDPPHPAPPPSPPVGDLRRSGSAERNSPEAKVRQEPSERARASHWDGVRGRGSGTTSPLLRFQGIIFANELLDAMPVHRLGWDAEQRRWFEWGVTVEAGRFVWKRLKAQCDQSSVAVASEAGSAPVGGRSPFAPWHGLMPEVPAGLAEVLPDGFTTEIGVAAVRWWQEAASRLDRGRLLTLDYGLAAEEFLVPARSNGTLRGYQRHRVIADVLDDPGGQDLTAHVNFTAIARAGETAGLQTRCLCSQSEFLTDIARATWEAGSGFGEWTPDRVRQFQTLTHPEHLGRSFKLLLQSR